MIDGAAILMSMFFTMRHAGIWTDERGDNMLDGGAHFYDTYETSDGKYISIGSIEPQFYALLLEKTGLDKDEFAPQMDRKQWPALKARVTEAFKGKTRHEWCEIMEGSDVCFAPILSLGEVADHPHNKARNSYIEIDDVLQPAPAPRFSRTEVGVSHGSRIAGEDTAAVLGDAGFTESEIESLVKAGAVSSATG
jgi:alpha-methylacyl-CoA racemase